jgi:hypothetical protein
MHETHFVLGQHWKSHLLREHAKQSGAMTVAKMRTWIDQPQAMGLPRELQNLIILTFALQTNRSFFLHGGPMQPTLENLPDELELREQKLPPQQDWEKARDRASAIFGVPSSPLLNASNVSKLIGDIQKELGPRKESCGQLVARLRQLVPQLGEPGTTPQRLRTAQAAQALVNALSQAEGDAFLTALIQADVASSEQAVGSSFKKSADVVDALGRVKWELLEAVLKLDDERQAAAQALWNSAKQAFQADELAIALGPALSEAESKAVRLLADVPKPKPKPQPGVGGGEGKDSGQGSTATTVTPSRRRTFVCINSDEQEVAAFYQGNQAALERNRRLVEELKAMYGTSQVRGDSLPEGLPVDKVRDALEVHHIAPLSKSGADERSNMIVVSATMHALIHSDPNCVIDLTNKRMSLFGLTIELSVDAGHNG